MLGATAASTKYKTATTTQNIGTSRQAAWRFATPSGAWRFFALLSACRQIIGQILSLVSPGHHPPAAYQRSAQRSAEATPNWPR
jgi:hypothetical protein